MKFPSPPFLRATLLALASALPISEAASGPQDAAVGSAPPARWSVHEWGTFTVLQDEQGIGLPGVNINEETLPPFVHRLERDLTPDSHEHAPLLRLGTHQRFASKGIPRSCPAARMRMETPILYFYPPSARVEQLDVRVDFFRGWISEWYPDAEVRALGFEESEERPMIPREGFSSVTWKNLSVGGAAQPPATDSRVWLAPRIPRPASVATPSGEAERYLFYRGVADLAAPLRVSRSPQVEEDELHLRANARELAGDAPYTFSALWLVDVRADRQVAFRAVPAITSGTDVDAVLATVPALFEASDYAAGHLRELRAAMAVELRKAGLFADEAEAMLDTWEVSYFHSAGLRLFFVLPRAWVDAALPLHLSKPADVARVMIGRIELVTAQQRALVARMARAEVPSTTRWYHERLNELPYAQRAQAIAALTEGTESLESLGFQVPEDYRAYLALGRFRDAIVIDHCRRHAAPALERFIEAYDLDYFHPPR
ncbi:MAG: hypothetical protein JNM84_01415 [Planctomycetes bacterium]|nr:hypothetical protein [Planctomycetota bacterium]